MELRWQPNLDVSALHAAWVLATGRPLLDKSLEEELKKPASELAQFCGVWQVSPALFWRHLMGLAVDLPNNTELAERLLKRLIGIPTLPIAATRLASQIAECEAPFRRRFPNLMEDLALRIGPLQSAWEARGPGILHMIAASTEPEFLVESASVILVHPVFGGDGLAHLYSNRVHIEAVLTDIEPRLPEVLRLAWLLGQLNLDRPMFSEQVHGHALGYVAELALIPVVLAAAEEVQLASLSIDSIELALKVWARVPEHQARPKAEVLFVWWETSTTGQWDWPTRLAGLAEMIDA